MALDPALGYAEPAFEEPQAGRTKVYYGNREAVAGESQSIAALLERLDALEARVESLEAQIARAGVSVVTMPALEDEEPDDEDDTP